MRKYVLQALFILSAFLLTQGCSDDENNVDLTKVGSAAAAVPAKVFFKLDATQAAVIDLSVAVDAESPESIGFEVKVADDSEVAADKVTFSRDRFSIEKGKRSFEWTCTVEADAVAEGVKNLRIDVISQNAGVKNHKLEIKIEKEKLLLNTIVHVSGLSQTVDFDSKTWESVMLGEDQIGGLFQTAQVIGSAPAVKRIHFDNYGENVIGELDGDLILLTPLNEGAVIGNGSAWVSNPGYSETDWMYMPVLYSENYQAWLGKTAYAGMNIQGVNYWFKFSVSANAEFTLTEFAYNEKGKDIRAGQIDSAE